MNCIDIIGIVKDKIDDFYRKFEYDVPFEFKDQNEAHVIVVRYWTEQGNNRLIMLPDNTRVAIHGHLDNTKEFGTILLVEQLEVIK